MTSNREKPCTKSRFVTFKSPQARRNDGPCVGGYVICGLTGHHGNRRNDGLNSLHSAAKAFSRPHCADRSIRAKSGIARRSGIDIGIVLSEPSPSDGIGGCASVLFTNRTVAHFGRRIQPSCEAKSQFTAGVTQSRCSALYKQSVLSPGPMSRAPAPLFTAPGTGSLPSLGRRPEAPIPTARARRRGHLGTQA